MEKYFRVSSCFSCSELFTEFPEGQTARLVAEAKLNWHQPHPAQELLNKAWRGQFDDREFSKNVNAEFLAGRIKWLVEADIRQLPLGQPHSEC